MKLHPPFAQPDPGRRAEVAAEEPAADSLSDDLLTPMPTTTSAVEDLPYIDEFLDDLPSIDEFVDDRPANEPTEPEEGWAAADWQSFDWNTVASLGVPPRESAQAQAAWSTTDWGIGSGGGSEPGAREIAAALDTLAHRIRTGELSLDRLRGTPPEAALAAALAALLRNRR